ncbi:formamidopyrimidine-DNA glycosylase [Sporichthya brevicatena]|uniref:Formamidopyrimidine-DNA glycosylase n=1 Tax=Sporichthya brevicatena TaxID=171442 RepID=A0ABP3SGU9_9ACTN
MPELPEVESARRVIESYALGRRIVDVDDSDTYECRPHSPGQIRDALVGRKLTEACRRGKSMWCLTGGVGRSRTPGPELGIHLGMSGKIVVADPNGAETDGGDYWARGRAAGDHRFTRFALRFDDGGYLLLVDPRRLGRVRLDPPHEDLGPDAQGIGAAEFRAMLGRSAAPVKARLLDQHAIAGIGNLLADQALWLARVSPRHPAKELSRAEADRLHKGVRKAITDAIAGGGVHTLSVIPYRKAGAECPRDGAPMTRGTVGGRTTWWCAEEQKL